MTPRDIAVGSRVVDTYNQEWEVIEIVQGCHLRLVDPNDLRPHRFIHSANWPTWRTWARKGVPNAVRS